MLDVTFTCDVCGAKVQKPLCECMPPLPNGWRQRKQDRRHYSHVCPTCVMEKESERKSP